MSRSFQLLLVIALLVFLPLNCNAQVNDLEQLYGSGVHAWYAGHPDDAVAAFDRAIEMGTRDPRVWFYRGVVRDALGQTDLAQADFQIGARLEASTTGRFFAVGRSLERVQGAIRLQIENARRQARLAAIEQAVALNADGSAIVALPIVPDGVTGQLVAPQMNFPDTSGGVYPNTPFAGTPAPLDSAAAPFDITKPMPGDAGAAAGNPPASAAPADPAKPPADQPADPFGEESDPPAGDPPMDEGTKDDPFSDDDGDKPGDADNPFGDGGDAGDQSDDSDSGSGGADEDDPFGDG